MSSSDFPVANSGRTVQYKLNAQSLRLFGLHSDVNDAHCAGAYLQNKQTNLDLLQDFLQRQLVKEMGSEIAGGGKDSQQTQPKTKNNKLLEQGNLFCQSNNLVRVLRKSKMFLT